MLRLVYKASELAAPPPDKSLDFSRMPPDRAAVIYGFNLSPFVFQIQDEGGQPLTIAQPFCPFKHRLNVRTEKIIVHVDSAAMAPAAPLGANDLRFWLEMSEHDQDLFPSAF
jgi:hypothetical protein